MAKPYTDIKVHWVNKAGQYGTDGSWPKADIIADMQAAHEQGYEIKMAEYIGETKEAYGILFVLVLGNEASQESDAPKRGRPKSKA